MYKTFMNWLFDGKLGSEIDKELLKYNSPITHTYVIGLFLRNSKLNLYLNTYLNNMNLRYLDKKELFLFIKKAVIDYNITRGSIGYIRYSRQNKISKELFKKFPYFKFSDISFLKDQIDKSDDRDTIYRSLGIEEGVKKQKMKEKPKGRKKKETTELKKETTITLEQLIKDCFVTTEV